MTTATFPRWTRIVAPMAALWYAFGLSQAIIGYLADATSVPLLVWTAYAVACIAGLIGSVALWFQPKKSFGAFVISLIAAIIYFGWLFGFGTATGEDYGIGATVIGVTLVLTLISRRF